MEEDLIEDGSRTKNLFLLLIVFPSLLPSSSSSQLPLAFFLFLLPLSFFLFLPSFPPLPLLLFAFFLSFFNYKLELFQRTSLTMSRAIFVRWSQVYNDKMSVKVTNSMTLREVRDLVCEKRKVDPAAHGLDLNGKVLDLNMTAMTANLQQGTKIDLVRRVQEDQGPFYILISCSAATLLRCVRQPCQSVLGLARLKPAGNLI